MARPGKKAIPQVIIRTDFREQNPNTYYHGRTPGPFRPVWCSEHHFPGPWPCDCPGGPQVIASGTLADEVALGGSRGSAKTAICLYNMAYRGNPGWKQRRPGDPRPADIAYLNHKNYRGLIMREQANDMGDLIDRFEEMYAPSGCQITHGNPAMAEWPTGAKITFGHFGDDGWKKYIGPEYQRILIDQAEKMPSLELYKRICGSLRSKWPELNCQTFLTFNPGGGDELSGAPGQAWLMEYFCIEAYLNGKVKPGQMIRDEEKKTRLYVHSTYKDNPYLLHAFEHDMDGNLVKYEPGEGKYVKWLNSIEPESLRRAWRDADFNALSGVYFRDFRPNGPLVSEAEQYPNAKHVFKPEDARLEPHWTRWVAVDWGYIHPTAILWGAKSPWGQTFIYREVCLNRTEPVELGVLIARESRADLEGLESRHMNLFMSPDAWAKRESENTVATQIIQGINKELGPGSAFLADLTDAEREMKADEALESMRRRRHAQTKTMLTVLRASTDRVAGWMHLQTMLRFRPLQGTQTPDTEFAQQLYDNQGLVAYTEYLNQPEFKVSAEVLPRLQISSDCRLLIKTIPMAMHKPSTNDIEKWDATETKTGDDALDALRYLAYSEERQSASLSPLNKRVESRVNAMLGENHGHSAHSVIMATEAVRYKELHPKKVKQQFLGHNRLEVARAMRNNSTRYVQ